MAKEESYLSVRKEVDPELKRVREHRKIKVVDAPSKVFKPLLKSALSRQSPEHRAKQYRKFASSLPDDYPEKRQMLKALDSFGAEKYSSHPSMIFAKLENLLERALFRQSNRASRERTKEAGRASGDSRRRQSFECKNWAQSKKEELVRLGTLPHKIVAKIHKLISQEIRSRPNIEGDDYPGDTVPTKSTIRNWLKK